MKDYCEFFAKEVIHSSLNLFENSSLLVTFDGSVCQKLRLLYNPNGPKTAFEVTDDKQNFIDLPKKVFLKSNIKKDQSSEANVKDDGTAYSGARLLQKCAAFPVLWMHSANQRTKNIKC